MRKSFSFVLVLLFYSFTSSSQITERHWMVGGSGSFTHAENKGSAVTNSDRTTLTASPNIGYFIWDNFCAGARVSFNSIKQVYTENPGNGAISYEQRITTYDLGPFLRYYFLDPEYRTNLFVDGCYQHQILKHRVPGNSSLQTANAFSINAGPVVYLNSTVGLEFTIGYSSLKYKGVGGRTNTVQANLGLQIHLQRDVGF